MELTDDELINILRSRLNQKKNTNAAEREMFKEIEVLSNKLVQSEKLKSNFLSNIRNEINNPLSSVLGLSKSMMEATAIDTDQFKRHAYLIHHEIFYLNFQMRNIFAAAEIEAGEMSVEPTLVDIRKLVEESVEGIRFKCNQKNIKLITSYNLDDIRIYTDGYMLFMIIINLLANAIEYSSAEDEVLVNVIHSDNKVTINVKDNGKGINVVDQSKIFKRFYQLDYGSTKKHNGHGLGLAIAQEFAEALKGTLSMKSTLGKGSLFSVTITALEEQSASVNSNNWNEFLFDQDTVL